NRHPNSKRAHPKIKNEAVRQPRVPGPRAELLLPIVRPLCETNSFAISDLAPALSAVPPSPAQAGFWRARRKGYSPRRSSVGKVRAIGIKRPAGGPAEA